jgi:hypothetical protein
VIFIVTFVAGNIVHHYHGLNNGSNQRLHGGGVPVMPIHQRKAGASDFSREGLTGAKFGMKIWSRIGGSCLGLLQTKTMSNNNEEKYVFKNT